MNKYDNIFSLFVRIKKISKFIRNNAKKSEKIILVQSESIENLLKSEQILEIIEEQNKILKIEMSESREELAYEREKQRSMEDLLINLNTDKGAIVAR